VCVFVTSPTRCARDTHTPAFRGTAASAHMYQIKVEAAALLRTRKVVEAHRTT